MLDRMSPVDRAYALGFLVAALCCLAGIYLVVLEREHRARTSAGAGEDGDGGSKVGRRVPIEFGPDDGGPLGGEALSLNNHVAHEPAILGAE